MHSSLSRWHARPGLVEPTINAVASYDGVCDSVEIAFE
jgi:hypothetical protein